MMAATWGLSELRPSQLQNGDKMLSAPQPHSQAVSPEGESHGGQWLGCCSFDPWGEGKLMVGNGGGGGGQEARFMVSSGAAMTRSC